MMLREITVFLLLLLLPIIGISQTVWINEIHYDNTGADAGEGVEIAGTAGTDLSCYDILAVNGSGGATYNTVNLSGIIPDEGCGYGAIWFPIVGLQNGAPDGVALYRTCVVAGLVQFLNYEGTTITATSAPIAGAVSTNIGVTETSGTAVGSSLQLTGSGNTYAAFAWNAPAVASIGVLNVGQTISPCGSNTITTGVITTAPFTVDCTAPTTDAGSVAFTSTGTFNGPNIYIVQLSDATGSFASPTNIGSLASTANSGSIPFTIPSATPTGAGYLMRVTSNDPSTVGSNSAVFTITQSAPCLPSVPAGLIINEWSNGASGNQEYYEFVVSGVCGTSVDIRGYILDDNNGTFTTPASYSGTASGIAPGHFRFSFAAQWATIPVGSLIVVYNANDPNGSLPADDPTDANVDSLYVVPHNSTLFERCTTFPTSASPDSTYTPCVYATAPLSGWTPLSLRNGGDAIQVRAPDGSYYHGVSYGGSEMTGGPHNLKQFTGSGTGMCGWFSDGDFFDITNWSSGTVGTNQTPGIGNNALNIAWLASMRDTSGITCPITVLPVEMSTFEGKRIEEGNLLFWQTKSEYNASHFILEHSTNAQNWTKIHQEAAVGQSIVTHNYSFIDTGFGREVNYYRLSQTDVDGTTTVFTKFVVIYNNNHERELVKIINILGQEIEENTHGIQIHIYSDGTSAKHFKQ